jgi:hypothetical protein
VNARVSGESQSFLAGNFSDRTFGSEAAVPTWFNLGKTFQIKFVESTRGIILRELGESINLNAVRSNQLGATGSTSGLIENKFAAPAIQLGESAVQFNPTAIFHNPTANSSGLSAGSNGTSGDRLDLTADSFAPSASFHDPSSGFSGLSCCSIIYTSGSFGASAERLGVSVGSFGLSETSYLLHFRLFLNIPPLSTVLILEPR